MLALSDYTLLLARLDSTSDEQARLLKQEARELLQRLAVIDSDRKERYTDLGRPRSRCSISRADIQSNKSDVHTHIVVPC